MGDHVKNPASEDASKASLPEAIQEQSLAPLTEVSERGSGSTQDEDNNKWEEICIGFWKQTKMRRKNLEPGKCYGITITLQKQ